MSTLLRPIAMLVVCSLIVVSLTGASLYHRRATERNALEKLKDVRFSYATAPLSPVWMAQWANRCSISLPDTVVRVFFETNSATDSDLVYLKQFTNLRHLYLDGAAITDAGLEHIEHLTRLEFLWLSGTQVTEDCITELKRALPDLTVYGP